MQVTLIILVKGSTKNPFYLNLQLKPPKISQKQLIALLKPGNANSPSNSITMNTPNAQMISFSHLILMVGLKNHSSGVPPQPIMIEAWKRASGADVTRLLAMLAKMEEELHWCATSTNDDMKRVKWGICDPSNIECDFYWLQWIE